MAGSLKPVLFHGFAALRMLDLQSMSFGWWIINIVYRLPGARLDAPIGF
jgi:hypothetical protein